MLQQSQTAVTLGAAPGCYPSPRADSKGTILALLRAKLGSGRAISRCQPATACRSAYESSIFIGNSPMKAIQVKQPGGPEAMELVDLPVPQPKPHEAMVKILAAGVNFIDGYNPEGRYKGPPPFIPGQDGGGAVSAVA